MTTALRMLAAAAAAATVSAAQAQSTITIVSHPLATMPQYTKVDVPLLPAWVQRCGARCGDVFNEVLSPITGVKYAK
jgi:hypothetical protein